MRVVFVESFSNLWHKQQQEASGANVMYNMDVLIKLPGIVSGNRSSIIYKIAFVWISSLFQTQNWTHVVIFLSFTELLTSLFAQAELWSISNLVSCIELKELSSIAFPRAKARPFRLTGNTFFRLGQRKAQGCDHSSYLFDFTNKATWPKSSTFGVKINCRAYLGALARGRTVCFKCKINISKNN